QYVHLQEANLASVDLTSANLVSANLYEANLENAHLGEAKLQHANLEGANLQGMILMSVALEHGEPIYRNPEFDENTILPDGTQWTPDTDMTRFTDPNHPDFWRSVFKGSPAYRSDSS
ncbi:MAG: pentapeptide repeat-containing protein, partial [Anaerolineaceae bacterium]|nr:pentapeptide repeat-containing protein [Anaerolineaceae bacterium]